MASLNALHEGVGANFIVRDISMMFSAMTAGILPARLLDASEPRARFVGGSSICAVAVVVVTM